MLLHPTRLPRPRDDRRLALAGAARHRRGDRIEAGEAYAPLTLPADRLRRRAAAAVRGLAVGVRCSPNALASLLRRDRARQMGPYKLLRQIGEGAISNVYLAQHRMLKRPAAVKVLKTQSTKEEWIARFQREVQLSSLLHHPNTIAIYDYGTGPAANSGMPWSTWRACRWPTWSSATARCRPRAPRSSCARPAPRCGRRMPAAWCIATSSRRTSCSATCAASATSSRCWISAWSSRSTATRRAT
jgi:hypothetical protein